MNKHPRKPATVTLSAPVVAPTRAPEIDAPVQPSLHGGVSLEEAIRARAYENWVRAGRPEGDGISFWLEAELELRGQSYTPHGRE